ncbi:SCO1664 family protein [Nocardioides panacis]|uniref:SCO1664 family protein n=1 Tax=Nocardioides panacis TaxID=2849501 RepID=A0A975Y1Q3_9ACTN|nr:SCO1664 family protein [Nocardioides panacis]QWZ09755.1 SCO1664 family protein [Nocardioides panacis]
MSSPAGETDEHELLNRGEIELQGRIMPASNATFFGTVTLDGVSIDCVYKPVAGERPLWDFPDGTLARREVAAYVVSEALGWDVVPPTVLRGDAPAGLGMVQAWREPDAGQDPVDLVPTGSAPEGYLHVLDAYDGDDRPVSLVHEDSVALRRMAVFDIVVNNADRKGGHVLAMPDGHRFGVDHGVAFNVEDKLRTVLWGWARQPLDPEDAAGVRSLLDRLATPTSELAVLLGDLLDADEVLTTRLRCEALLRRNAMPMPSGGGPSIPWPAF